MDNLTPKQAERRSRIEDAAYELLAETGYKSTSLLAVAQRAPCSNETLYRWYGNKQGLFRALVSENAKQAKALCEAALAAQQDALDALRELGPVLLSVVTGDKAVSLNRAAAGDVSDTATLGAAIAEAGRDTIGPLVGDLIARAARTGRIGCDDPRQASELYFSLLIGDLQIRRAIGVLGELTGKQIDERAQRAFNLFLKLHPPTDDKASSP